MTTQSDQDSDVQQDAAPYLPPSRPTATGASTPFVPATGPDAAIAPSLPAADTNAGAAPFVPAPVPVASEPAPAPVFDAKAMVESQKRFNAQPAYGALPTGTEASREAARKLRSKAQKKRKRNKRLSWIVAVLLLAGVGAGGWFGYQEYQDEQDRNAAESAAAAADDDNSDDPVALTPLGEQAEVIAGLETVSDTPVVRAGGFGNAIDDARAAVDGVNGDPAATIPPTPFTYAVVVPPIVRSIGERLPDATGRETYVVTTDEFAQGDPAAFGLFLRLMSIQPQLIPTASAFDGLPVIDADEMIISVDRDGDRVVRVVVLGESISLSVDVTP